MQENQQPLERIKRTHVIPPNPEYIAAQEQKQIRQIRTAAYCRVSTEKEEQELSFNTQVEFYTDKIMKNPEWRLADIFADEGITATSVKSRKEFKRMISWCKQGKIDQIITKSVSRFARNTVDGLAYVRMLKDMGIGVIFEKEGINTLEVSNELILTIYSGLAQAESESLSGNVKWGKQKSFRKGNVPISYKSFLGYQRGADGQPEVVPEEAAVIVRIYEEYLTGQSTNQIALSLTEEKIPTPMKREVWSPNGIHSILTNEKYKGDAILQKTFVEDCLTKKVKVNTGQLPKYYVENNHDPIIDSDTWNSVQEEIARRSSKPKTKEVGTKTEQGKYSSKYALTELLICGKCNTPYRRCTWTVSGKKKYVWRCISRLDYGKKYCKDSPTLEESVLQETILRVITESAEMDTKSFEILKMHIGMGLSRDECDEDDDDIYAMQVRLNEIGTEIDRFIKLESEAGNTGKYDNDFEKLLTEKNKLKERIAELEKNSTKKNNNDARIREIFDAVDQMKNRPLTYDDKLIRQMIESISVMSESRLKIRFRWGIEIEVDM
jgi:Site-specific recombinases, DNA invertase Pin homologs